jgi:hypothetical protein
MAALAGRLEDLRHAMADGPDTLQPRQHQRQHDGGRMRNGVLEPRGNRIVGRLDHGRPQKSAGAALQHIRQIDQHRRGGHPRDHLERDAAGFRRSGQERHLRPGQIAGIQGGQHYRLAAGFHQQAGLVLIRPDRLGREGASGEHVAHLAAQERRASHNRRDGLRLIQAVAPAAGAHA